jgi:X-X-X-Leu-X-X-Gly heptad repeat protein
MAVDPHRTRSQTLVKEEAMALRKKKSLLDQASDYIDQVRPQVESAVASALDAAEEFYETTARPALVDAKAKAGPALADARDKAAVALADARDQAAPLVAEGAAKASEKASELAAKASELADQAKEAAEAQVANVRGEEKKKGSKLKKFAIFAAIAGVIGVVARKIQTSGQSDNWQSSYVPTPAPAPTTNDAGAAGPDEALSDAADEPHAVTTPDDPAEVVDLESPVEDASKKK